MYEDNRTAHQELLRDLSEELISVAPKELQNRVDSVFTEQFFNLLECQKENFLTELRHFFVSQLVDMMEFYIGNDRIDYSVGDEQCLAIILAKSLEDHSLNHQSDAGHNNDGTRALNYLISSDPSNPPTLSNLGMKFLEMPEV